MNKTAQADQGIARVPAYQRIKNFVLENIGNGTWQEGDVIPTELALCKQFNVSRMTVHRALRELTQEQILVRFQGSGTFVAPSRIQSTLIEIRSIAQEIRGRGNIHSCKVLQLECIRANPDQTAGFRLEAGAQLFHSIIVHYENDTPIQVEDRLVDARRMPDYPDQDWDAITPGEYLLRAAPCPTGHYTVEVMLPSQEMARLLNIDVAQPCLVLERTSFSGGSFASHSVKWFAGNRYRLAGQF